MHYLDNAATTPVRPEVTAAIAEALNLNFGNPSSLYGIGAEAEKILSAARRTVADAMGARPDEVFFTASGTESNNIAILGAARARSAWGDTVITTGFEHPSVQNTIRALREEGFKVIEVKPKNGVIDPEDILSRVDKKTALVAAMHVNNETGAMLDVASLAADVKCINKRTAFHCDNVQGFLKEKLRLDGSIDTVAVSGHKIHAPKGIGALYIRKGFNIKPVIFGGGQEKGIRPGTENVAYAAGFAEAVRCSGSLMENRKAARELSAYLREGLKSLDNIIVNTPDNASPYILNFSFLGYRSETVLHFLESMDVYVSGGSACSKGQKSHTLEAMGLSDRAIDSGIRVSFSTGSTREDVDALLLGLKKAKETLMRAY